jgi:hypothetical protein
MHSNELQLKETKMRTHLIKGVVIIIVSLIAAIGSLLCFPRRLGFTITTSRSTNYVDGGVLLASLIVIGVGISVSIYLAYKLVVRK